MQNKLQENTVQDNENNIQNNDNNVQENTTNTSELELDNQAEKRSYLYKRLLSYVKQWWVAFVVSVTGFAIYSASSTAFAEVTKQMVDVISSGKASDYRYYFPLLVIGLFILRGIGSFFGNYFLEKIGRNLVHRLRVDIFNHLLILPTKFYNKNPYGHLVSRITFNVEQVTGAGTYAITIIVREGLFVVGMLSYLFWVDWKLTLILLTSVPLVAVILNVASKKFTRYSNRIQKSMGDVTHIAGETISGINLVKAYSGQEFEQQRFLKASFYNKTQALKMIMTQHIASPLIQIIVVHALALLIFLAMSPDLLGGLTGGEFVAFILAAALIIKPIKQLADVNSTIQKGLAAAEDIFKLIDAPIEEDNGKLEIEKVNGALEFKNVDFRYDADLPLVLQNLNLNIKAGEIIALVGRSGGGKSTLVNLIPRFYEIEKGNIYLDETDLKDINLKSLRKQIAIVTQEVVLFNTSLRENITYGIKDVCEADLQKAIESSYVKEFSDKLEKGLETIVGDRGVNLSGGQKQRVALARAILKNAPILILDEATSALDNESERFIQKALNKVMQGRTTIIIAHRLSTIESADRILVIDAGKVVEEGTHAQLMQKAGIYSNLRQANQLELN